MFLFEKSELVDDLEQAEAVGGETITMKKVSEESRKEEWNEKTSSPSPMQLPNNVQADQFHLKPAKEISTHSMASSRLDKRERKRAFLFECKHDIIDQTRLKPESNLQEKEPGVYGVFDDF